ncbi:hypothetical protein MR532_07225, partial [bacterium]|nr:hypothetical protein [bacterium]
MSEATIYNSGLIIHLLQVQMDLVSKESLARPSGRALNRCFSGIRHLRIIKSLTQGVVVVARGIFSPIHLAERKNMATFAIGTCHDGV